MVTGYSLYLGECVLLSRQPVGDCEQREFVRLETLTDVLDILVDLGERWVLPLLQDISRVREILHLQVLGDPVILYRQREISNLKYRKLFEIVFI